jgi:WD40 repeat protein
LLFEYKVHSARYSDACFTPDGKRIAAVWHDNNNRVIRIITDPKMGKTDSRTDDEVCLFDLDRQEKIGSFKPHAYGLGTGIRAMAVSHDGQSFVIWSGAEINLVDFQAAFGVAALPPSLRLQGPDQLPLKEVTGNPEPPRKRK